MKYFKIAIHCLMPIAILSNKSAHLQDVLLDFFVCLGESDTQPMQMTC